MGMNIQWGSHPHYSGGTKYFLIQRWILISIKVRVNLSRQCSSQLTVFLSKLSYIHRILLYNSSHILTALIDNWCHQNDLLTMKDDSEGHGVASGRLFIDSSPYILNNLYIHNNLPDFELCIKHFTATYKTTEFCRLLQTWCKHHNNNRTHYSSDSANQTLREQMNTLIQTLSTLTS